MTSPLQPSPHDQALATAIEATIAEASAPPSRAPTVLAWIRGIATVLMIGGSLLAPAQPPIGVWIFGGILMAALFAVSGITKRRAGKQASGWVVGGAAAVLVAGLSAAALGLLSIPWAAGALALGSLLGWWGAHMEAVGESLLWTPGADDLRYQDAGGTLDHAEFLAVIVSPLEPTPAAIADAAKQVAQLGELRDVLAWLSIETGTAGRMAVDDLSDQQRLVLALALRAHAAKHGPTLPTPRAPSLPTLPA